MDNTTKVSASVDFADGVTCEMDLLNANKLKKCAKGARVGLNFNNGETWFGFFERMDEREVVIKGVTSKHSVGLPIDKISSFYKEV